MVTTQEPLTQQRANRIAVEYKQCRGSFEYFVTHYVYILEPPPGAGIIKFQPWPHLMEFTQALAQHRLLLVLKARQLGFSWLVAAYGLWWCIFYYGSVILKLSRNQDEAFKLLEKAKFVDSQLPEWLRLKRGSDSGGEITYPTQQSVITALPSTPDAGRGPTASVVICDELDFHPYAEENYSALKPTIDAGGQFIGLSTANKFKVVSKFKELYKGAKNSENNFKVFFYPWTCRPGRDQAWYDAQKKDDPIGVEKEYPNTEQEALAPSSAACYFNVEKLKAMLDDVKSPIETRKGGLIRIWKPVVVGKKYTAGADPGTGGAYSKGGLAILDWATGEHVADIHGSIHPDDLAQESATLCKEYNLALLGGECNNKEVGGAYIKKVLEIGYPNLYYRNVVNGLKKPEHAGWQTDSKTRPVMLAELEEAIRNRQLTSYCQEFIGECYSFIRNEKGRIEGAEGSTDDRVMKMAIAWQMRKHVKMGSGGFAMVKSQSSMS